MRKIPAALTILLLVFVFAANVRRARKQSFTIDEARTYLLFVDVPWRDVLVNYDANNHVLNTLLERGTAAAFGVSEFTLRLPSLAGGALYLAAVFLLCRRLFGTGPLLVLSVATLTLNPYLRDFLSAARGYGMALAFFLWALEFVLRYFDDARAGQLWRASVALGLAAAANLTLVFPGAILVAVVAVVLARRREWRALADQFPLPGLAVAFVFLAIPLSHATGAHFYVGASSLGKTLEGLVRTSLDYGAPGPRWLREASLRLAPAALGACVLLAAGLLWRRRAPLAPEERFFALCVGTLAGSIALAVVLHRLAGLPYPLERTGLYLIPLAGLTGFALLRLAARHRWAACTVLPAGILFFSMCVVQFALRWNSRSYLDWLYDARTRDLVGTIERRHAGGSGATSVMATWPLGQTVEFYKRVRRLDWLEVKHRQIDPGPAEYYILTFDDLALAGKLEVLERDESVRVVLARAKGP